MDKAVGIYTTIKESLPDALVATACYDPVSICSQYYESTPANIALLDKYVVHNTTSDLSDAGNYVREVRNYTKKNPGLAVGIVHQTFVFQGSEPTVAQLRAQTYLGIVNGARAFIYYSYIEDYSGIPFTQWKANNPETPNGMSKNPLRDKWWLPDSNMWDAFPSLISELHTLENIILNDGKLINIKLKSGNL